MTRLIDADSRLLRSLLLLLSSPGRLTVHYLKGNRTPYIGPIQLFALVNVFIVLMAASGRMQVFNTSLRLHVTATSFFHQDMAARWVNARISAPVGWEVREAIARKDALHSEKSGASGDDQAVPSPSEKASLDALASFRRYAERFDQRAQMLSESLVFLLIPMLVVLFAAMDVRQTGVRLRRGWLVHLVQATHVTTFWLLALPLTAILIVVGFGLLMVAGAVGEDAVRRLQEPTWTVCSCIAMALYTAVSVRRTYRTSWFGAAVRGAMVGLLIIPCVQVYRAALFVIGFYTT